MSRNIGALSCIQANFHMKFSDPIPDVILQPQKLASVKAWATKTHPQNFFSPFPSDFAATAVGAAVRCLHWALATLSFCGGAGREDLRRTDGYLTAGVAGREGEEHHTRNAYAQ